MATAGERKSAASPRRPLPKRVRVECDTEDDSTAEEERDAETEEGEGEDEEEEEDEAEVEDDEVEDEDDEADEADEGEDAGEENIKYEAPAMSSKFFSSWDEFHAALNKYSAKTHQIYTVGGMTLASTRNNRIPEAQRSVASVSATFQHYNKLMRCTHGGKMRKRAEGKRPRQQIRWTGCQAQLRSAEWMVVVTNHYKVHNHPLSKRHYRQYANVRTRVPKKVEDDVRQMRRNQGDRRTIWFYVRDHGNEDFKMKDVHNLLARMKKDDYTAPTQEDRVTKYLADFREIEGNDAHTFVTAAGLLNAIVWATAHMRQTYACHPEVMLVHATHGTNRENFKLFSFMVHDAFGNGQFVQHAFVENERKETLAQICEAFKKANPTWAERLQCIVIDKDLTEVDALRDAFPGVRILPCEFHVKKYLKSEVSDATKYGFTQFEKDELQSCITLLVGAQSQASYDGVMEYMFSIFDDESRLAKWRAYFEENWHKCRDMWALYLRGNVAHLGNHTNNRLESGWGKVKLHLNRDMKLDESLVAVMMYQERMENDWNDRLSKIGTIVIGDDPEELQRLANIVSKHAFDLVREQWNLAHSLHYEFHGDGRPIHFVRYVRRDSDNDDSDLERVDDVSEEYKMNVASSRCSCLFASTRLLPCRHVIFVRKARGITPEIPFNHLNPRWKLSSLRSCTPPSVDPVDDGEMCVKVSVQAHRAMSQQEKYRVSRAITDDICSLASEFSTSDFLDVATFLEKTRPRSSFFRPNPSRSLWTFECTPTTTPVTEKKTLISPRKTLILM